MIFFVLLLSNHIIHHHIIHLLWPSRLSWPEAQELSRSYIHTIVTNSTQSAGSAVCRLTPAENEMTKTGVAWVWNFDVELVFYSTGSTGAIRTWCNIGSAGVNMSIALAKYMRLYKWRLDDKQLFRLTMSRGRFKKLQIKLEPRSLRGVPKTTNLGSDVYHTVCVHCLINWWRPPLPTNTISWIRSSCFYTFFHQAVCNELCLKLFPHGSFSLFWPTLHSTHVISSLQPI
jgi:hypothetical protein